MQTRPVAIEDEPVNSQDLNIYQKLAKIRNRVKVLKKDKRGYNYNYLSDEIIMASISGAMNELGVSLIPFIKPGTSVIQPVHYTKTKVLKDGKVIEEQVNEVLVHQEMEYHWVNNDHPDDRVVVPWFSVGQQQDPSQAFGSGLTYSSRYFKLQYFGISATENDPDAWRSKQREADDLERKEVNDAIVNQIDTLVNQYLASLPKEAVTEKRDAIVAIIKNYAVDRGKPSANYMAITDPAVSGALLQALKAFIAPVEQKPAEEAKKAG